MARLLILDLRTQNEQALRLLRDAVSALAMTQLGGGTYVLVKMVKHE